MQDSKSPCLVMFIRATRQAISPLDWADPCYWCFPPDSVIHGAFDDAAPSLAHLSRRSTSQGVALTTGVTQVCSAKPFGRLENNMKIVCSVLAFVVLASLSLSAQQI